jgi:hypothetical protein
MIRALAPRLAVATRGEHTAGVTAEICQDEMTVGVGVGVADADFADIDFADVPDADPNAVVDPHWLQLRGDSLLPSLYMPPTMPGQRSSLMRLVASALIGVFMLATTLGICLTYGPPPT